MFAYPQRRPQTLTGSLFVEKTVNNDQNLVQNEHTFTALHRWHAITLERARNLETAAPAPAAPRSTTTERPLERGGAKRVLVHFPLLLSVDFELLGILVLLLPVGVTADCVKEALGLVIPHVVLLLRVVVFRRLRRPC